MFSPSINYIFIGASNDNTCATSKLSSSVLILEIHIHDQEPLFLHDTQ
jgi:hypothetical protein